MDTESGDTTAQALVGISFESHSRAQEFLLAAAGLAAAGHLRLKDAVTVLKDDAGQTVVHETIDPPLARSAWTGAMWAGLFGLILGGPVGWIAGIAAGAGAGAISAKMIDLGITDEWVAWFKDAVRPGRAIVALLVEDLDHGALVDEVARFRGATIVYTNLDADVVERLRSALASPSTPSISAPLDEIKPGVGSPL